MSSSMSAPVGRPASTPWMSWAARATTSRSERFKELPRFQKRTPSFSVRRVTVRMMSSDEVGLPSASLSFSLGTSQKLMSIASWTVLAGASAGMKRVLNPASRRTRSGVSVSWMARKNVRLPPTRRLLPLNSTTGALPILEPPLRGSRTVGTAPNTGPTSRSSIQTSVGPGPEKTLRMRAST